MPILGLFKSLLNVDDGIEDGAFGGSRADVGDSSGGTDGVKECLKVFRLCEDYFRKIKISDSN